MAENITIIARKSFRFYNPNTPKPEPTSQGDLDRAFKESVAVYANPNVQTVPAWIKTQPMYDWAVKDGDIMEVTIKSKPPEPKKDDEGSNGATGPQAPEDMTIAQLTDAIKLEAEAKGVVFDFKTVKVKADYVNALKTLQAAQPVTAEG